MLILPIRNHNTYLKNLIFLKCIVLAFLFCIFIWYSLVIKQNILDTESRIKTFENHILAIKRKLFLVSLDDKSKLQTLSQNIGSIELLVANNCNNRRRIISGIKNLINTYSVNEEVEINVVKSFDNEKNSLHLERIKVEEFDIIVNFNVLNFESMVTFIKGLEAFLPKNVMIKSINVTATSALNRTIIDKLLVTRVPSLIRIKLLLLIKQISKP